MTDVDRSALRIAVIAGVVGVAGNVLGVAVLGDIPTAYRPSTLPLWVDQVAAAPIAATWSGVGFTVGLVGLAVWAWMTGRWLKTSLAATGAFIVAAGALLNAAGTLAPAVVAWHVMPMCEVAADCRPAGGALLAMSLSLDAFFNALLGLGLLCWVPALSERQGRMRWLTWLAGAAGVASIPVSLQLVSDRGADMLAIAGPLWLAFILATSLAMWNERAS